MKRHILYLFGAWVAGFIVGGLMNRGKSRGQIGLRIPLEGHDRTSQVHNTSLLVVNRFRMHVSEARLEHLLSGYVGSKYALDVTGEHILSKWCVIDSLTVHGRLLESSDASLVVVQGQAAITMSQCQIIEYLPGCFPRGHICDVSLALSLSAIQDE